MFTKKQDPIILCAGSNGRAVIFGTPTKKPVPGQPVTLKNARMVLRWAASCGGLFGLAAKGPKGDTRMTHAVAETTATQWRETVAVSTEAAKGLESWPAA